jgi:hypothetical protein
MSPHGDGKFSIRRIPPDYAGMSEDACDNPYMSRRSRLVTALLAAAALLFSQLAVSGYACPGMEAPAAHSAAVAGEDCDESGTANLCQQHCEYGKTALEQAKPLKMPIAVAVTGIRPLVRCDAPQAVAATFERFVSVAGPPPLSRSTVLRI